MSGKLSDRFSKLASTGNNDRARDNRVQQRSANQKDKRTAKTQERRGLTVTVAKNNNRNNANKGDAKKSGGLVRTRKPKVGNVGKNNKAINKKGNAGRNNRKGSKKPSEKKALPSADDLDKEMDTYWFAAGKGPNPDVANLDKDMDDYFAARKTSEAATEAPATA